MPIYEYQACDPDTGCGTCRTPFEQFQNLRDAPRTACPQCGRPVRRLISAPAVGASKSGLDDRAKAAGFTKLKKVSKGEYERKY